MNMGFSVGDDESHVIENRKRFFDVLGAEASQLINCRQVHGVRMEQVGRKDCGRGALSPDTAIADCDGLYTNESGVPLTMNFADCVPLLLYDPVTHSLLRLRMEAGGEVQEISVVWQCRPCSGILERCLKI